MWGTAHPPSDGLALTLWSGGCHSYMHLYAWTTGMVTGKVWKSGLRVRTTRAESDRPRGLGGMPRWDCQPRPRGRSGEGSDTPCSYHPHCQGGYRAWWLWLSTSVLVCRLDCVRFFLQDQYWDLIYCFLNDTIIPKDSEWAALPSSLHSKGHEAYGTRAGSEVGDAHTSVDIPRSDRHTACSSFRDVCGLERHCLAAFHEEGAG